MTTIVGLTGGIASGKTTIVKLLKKNKLAVQDSDFVVGGIYSKPKTKFTNYLKKINLGQSLKGKKIDKKIIREEIFFNIKKRKLLESYIHTEVKKSRNLFIKKHKQKKTKIIFLDIPLLFEKKLEKICDSIILFYAPLTIRKKRAIRRKGMQKKILEKIIKT
ncbi:uncharacterized protein METZ01_LOCUS371656, partial [marine metagenome]